MAKQKKYRLQFDLSEADYERFKQLQEASQAPTNAALVAKALAVYQWILEQKKENAKIHIERDGNMAQVELLTP